LTSALEGGEGSASRPGLPHSIILYYIQRILRLRYTISTVC